MRSFFVKEIIYIAQALRVWAFFRVSGMTLT